MATQVSSSRTLDPNATDGTWFGWLSYFLTKRRITISIVVFASLLALDLFVFHVKPRNLLNYRDPWVVLGVSLVVLGVAIRSWAAGTLHKMKELTRSGPYAMVRNPLYVGSFFMMFGFCALIADAHTIWIIAGPIVFMYWLKVRQEENWLAELFPQDWADYVRSTPRFVPRKIALPTAEGFSLAQWAKHREWQAVAASALALAGLQMWHWMK